MGGRRPIISRIGNPSGILQRRLPDSDALTTERLAGVLQSFRAGYRGFQSSAVLVRRDADQPNERAAHHVSAPKPAGEGDLFEAPVGTRRSVRDAFWERRGKWQVSTGGGTFPR